MPEFYQESSFSSDTSSLSAGRHPACLCLITEEPIPEGWQMGAGGAKTMWRWHFAVWDTPAHIATTAPEHQSAVSSRTFSPGGKNPASKAFLWTEQLLGRRPNPGERINLDPMLPLPCALKIARTKNDGSAIDYARVIDLESAPQLASLMTPELRHRLLALSWVRNGGAGDAPQSPPPATKASTISNPPPVQPQTNPAMVGWGNAQGVVTPPPLAPSW